MYNSASTIHQGVKANTDAKVLKAKLVLNWTGPYKVLAVGLCSCTDTPDGSPLGDNLHLDLPCDLPGLDARRRVVIKRYKPCANPHDSDNMPKYPPVGLAQYALNNFPKKSPPYHVTHPSNDYKWSRSPATSRSGGEVESSLCYTRSIEWDSLHHPGSGKLTSNSLAPTCCVIGPALRTSTAKPTTCTAGCALMRHSASFPGTTVNVVWRRATLASRARSGFAAAATRCSPREPTFGTRVTIGCGGLKKSVRVRRTMEYT